MKLGQNGIVSFLIRLAAVQARDVARVKLHFKSWSWFYPGPLYILLVGLSPLLALLGFVALNPTYILPVLLRNAKPNNGRFRNRAPKASISIKLAAF
jgi:hypothetical protein